MSSDEPATTDDPHLRPTPILDYLSAAVQTVAQRLADLKGKPLDFLRAAHRILRTEVGPVYTVDELQAASTTIAKKKGSCSQRFACLESLARWVGIPTRVRGLWVAGKFWAPRFPFARIFVPSRILLAWPQFTIDGEWVDADELFATPQQLAEQSPGGFANDGEPMFDAIDHVAIDFAGKTAGCAGGQCDLSRFARGGAGTFASRDELFAAIPLFQRTLRGKVFEFIYGGRKSN